jgi:hypothetical protein
LSATFHLDDLGDDLASALPDLAVGPWRCAPAGLVAFDTGEPSAPRWRVRLGRDDAANQRALSGGERSVAETHTLLDDFPDRLERAIDHALAERSLAVRPPTPESPTWGQLASSTDPGAALIAESTTGSHPGAARTRESTAAPTRGRLASPLDPGAPLAPVRAAEARLIAALTGGAAPLELARLAWSAEPAPAEPEPGRLGQLLDRVADLARGRSRIETRVEGALVAQSITTLTGDTELWIAPRLSPAGARLHARSVAVAVRTRHAWARILTLTVRGAGRLAMLGLPGGAISAVPLVWRFVRDVLRELRQRNAALRQAV